MCKLCMQMDRILESRDVIWSFVGNNKFSSVKKLIMTIHLIPITLLSVQTTRDLTTPSMVDANNRKHGNIHNIVLRDQSET